MDLQEQKRITVKLKCPNPLFEQWLTEWRDQAKAKDSKIQYIYSRALQSLKKYPLPLESGRECGILKGFGDRICKMLDEKLREHKKVNKNKTDITPSQTQPNNISRKLNQDISSNSTTKRTSSATKSKTYVPQHGTGAYAILITLYKKSLEPNYPGYLTKSEIIQYGQQFVNSSFTKPDPGSRYTAWSSMRTLLSKNLVSKESHPPKFSLTEEGLVLAKKMYKNSSVADITDDNNLDNIGMILDCNNKLSPLKENQQNLADTERKDEWGDDNFWDNINQLECNDYMSGFDEGATYKLDNKVSDKKSLQKYSSETCMSNVKSTLNTKQTSLQTFHSSSSLASVKSSVSIAESFLMSPNNFDIILYVDTNETSGASNSHNDQILVGLSKCNIKHEVKDLKVGDFTWVCRDRVTKKELVLPYVIERKRMDDFAHSIKDKRYHEQKFRLKRSGLENLTYLIESHGNNQHAGLPLQTLYQAATNTAIQENFFVQFTENIRETVQYLADFSKMLVKMYKSKTLASCPKDDLKPININDDLVSLMTFKEFNESSVKNKKMKVTELFIKMLLQIKGMSVERALAVTQKYPTPQSLYKAYEATPGSKGEKLLADIKFGKCSKSIGAVLSKIVYQAFNKPQY